MLRLFIILFVIVNVAFAISDKQLSYRHWSLFKDRSFTLHLNGSKKTAGMAELLPRSYENAPPQIPHSLKGISYNSCTGCHERSVAKSVGATPIPLTHYTNYRPSIDDYLDFHKKVRNDNLLYKDTAKKLDGSRENCVICHVRKNTKSLVVKNVFKPYFRTPETKHRSNLYKVMNDGEGE